MKALRKVMRRCKMLLLNPKLKISKTDLGLNCLGSLYGGWTFYETDELNYSTIVSCGLGEDASFDVEIASRFGLKILLIDPTPRALAHFQQITARLGQPKISEYSKIGLQLADSYDLTKLNTTSLKLIPQAIWKTNGVVPFYEPPEEKYVSHSIVNFQNNYAVDTKYIEVESVTLRCLLESHSLDSIPLIKLDVEGAEIEVIQSFLDDGIFPNQILVEYDELHKPSIKSRQKVIHCHERLLDAGYLLVHYSKPSNYLYLSKLAFGL